MGSGVMFSNFKVGKIYDVSLGLIFSILINILGVLIPIIYLPAFFASDKKIGDKGAKSWALISIWLLKKICKIDYKIIGIDNIPKEPCIVACKHQSMWETIVMHLIFHRPVYAYKKELERIPFYGWFLTRMSGISVDRDGGSKSIKNIIKQSRHYIDNNQSIVIFPQGTRVPVEANAKDYPYQVGVAAIYLSCKVKVVPVALNSGLYWPKKSIRKKSGTITIEFLKPIEVGLNREEFMNKIEEVIENKSNELLSKKY